MIEKYENLGTVGEGSYGIVLKCRDKTNNMIVAIKKFLEPDNDKAVRKIAGREIKILKSLRHENLVNLIEVFRKNRRIFLVFEFIEQNLLEEIEKSTHGLGENRTREIMYQVVRGIDFMHKNNYIHRDLKPENVLINKNGLVKLCDFGFSRQISQTSQDVHTDYVATRWYRSPELLVGDPKYGKSVDIWSIGVLTYEVLTSKPLFPGESDLDQLYLIINYLGELPDYLKSCFQNNQFYLNAKLPKMKNFTSLQNKLKKYSPELVKFIMESLVLDQNKRLNSAELLRHSFFNKYSWADDYLIKLKDMVILHESKFNNLVNIKNNENSLDDLAKLRNQNPNNDNKINSLISISDNYINMIQNIPNDSKISDTSVVSDSSKNQNIITDIDKMSLVHIEPMSARQIVTSLNNTGESIVDYDNSSKKNSVIALINDNSDNNSLNRVNIANKNNDNDRMAFKRLNNQSSIFNSESFSPSTNKSHLGDKNFIQNSYINYGTKKMSSDLLKIVKLQNKDIYQNNEKKSKYFSNLEEREFSKTELPVLTTPIQLKSLNVNNNTNLLYKTHNLNLYNKKDQFSNLHTNKNTNLKKSNNNIDFNFINDESTSNLSNDLIVSLNTSNNTYNDSINNKSNNFKHFYYDDLKNKKEILNQNQHSNGNSHKIKFNIAKQNNLNKQLNFLKETSIYKLPEMKTHDTLPKQKRVLFDKKQPYYKT